MKNFMKKPEEQKTLKRIRSAKKINAKINEYIDKNVK